jgi:nicotinate-nucleotide adenylyltransferase
MLDISATQIRRRAARGEPIDDLVPPGVARYIADHHLYKDAAAH